MVHVVVSMWWCGRLAVGVWVKNESEVARLIEDLDGYGIEVRSVSLYQGV